MMLWILLLAWLGTAGTYHLGDDEMHCWRNTLLQTQPSQCLGFDLQWIEEFPTEIYPDQSVEASVRLLNPNDVPISSQVANNSAILIPHYNVHACRVQVGFCDMNFPSTNASGIFYFWIFGSIGLRFNSPL